MNRFIKCGSFAMAITLAAVFFFDAATMADAKEQVIVALAGGRYPEGGEGVGLNMFLEALEGRMLNHPALKTRYRFKNMDKGMLFSTQDEALTGVASGACQLTYSGPHFLEQFDPAWKLGEAPGVFDSWEHFVKSMKTPAWQELQERMAKEKGVTILKWAFNAGNWYLFSSKGPIKNKADIKGMQVRIAGGEAFTRALKAMGATAVSLPYTEVITALQTNMISGALTDLMAAIYYFHLENYTRYLVPTTWALQPICIVVNTKWWEGLPAESRAAMNDTFERIDVSQWYEGVFDQLEAKWAAGPETKLNRLDEDESKIWQEIMQKSVAGMIDKIDPKYMEAINSVR